MLLLRALVIDDQQSARLYAERLLLSIGIECIAASDGIEALRHASPFGIDLIVTELRLARLDVPELIELVRRGAFGLPPPPIIVCSAPVGDFEQLRPLTPADDVTFLAKPFHEREFEAAVDAAFGLEPMRSDAA